MLRLGIALLAIGISGKAMAGGGSEEGEEAERPEASGETPAASSKATTGRRPSATGHKRGRGKVSGHVVLESELRDSLPPPPSGNIHLFSLAEHESLKVNIYNPDGSYNVDAIKAVTHILRCKRTETEKEVEPRLLMILSHIYDHFGEHRIEVVSGFRNQRKTTSYHFKASASDIRIEGVKPAKVRAFAETLDAGGMGIGLYPRSGFVHVDVRPPPSFRWIDYSSSNPDAPEKRPPRNFKKKRRLQS